MSLRSPLLPGSPSCMPACRHRTRKRIWTARLPGSPRGRPGQGITVGRVVTETGSALNGKRRKFLSLLRDPSVTTIVVEHRDRFARFGAEYVEAALAASGRRLLVADPAEIDDDLVRDVTEILTSLCARLYGARAAANRAARELAAMESAGA